MTWLCLNRITFAFLSLYLSDLRLNMGLWTVPFYFVFIAHEFNVVVDDEFLRNCQQCEWHTASVSVSVCVHVTGVDVDAKNKMFKWRSVCVTYCCVFRSPNAMQHNILADSRIRRNTHRTRILCIKYMIFSRCSMLTLMWWVSQEVTLTSLVARNQIHYCTTSLSLSL